MALLTKFASRKLLVLLGTVGIALLPNFTEKMIKAIDWRIFALAGGYMVLNVVQKIGIALIENRKLRGSD